jgi:hypothetical protein
VFDICVEDFDRIEIAEDELVRAVREFLPVMEINVVALAVAADTLRRLCVRRDDLFSGSFRTLKPPLELRIFDTGDIIVEEVPGGFPLAPESLVGEVMIELIV